MYTTNGQNGAISIIRKMSVSVLFLVGAIGYSVYVLFGLVGSLAGGSEVTDLMDQIMAMSGGYSSLDYSAVRAVSGMFNGISVFSMLVSMLPAMVIVAGIWLIFAAAKRNMLPGTASAGLTMARVIAIIQLVFACIGAVLLEILCIVALSAVNSVSGYYGSTGSVNALLVFIMIIFAGVAAVQIIYYLKLNKMIVKTKDTLLTGQPDDDISLYVEILCYISGGVAAIGALMSLADVEVLNFFANAGMATADICFAILIRQYRSKMGLLIHNPQQFYQEMQMAEQRTQQQRGAQQPYQGQQQWAQQPYQPQQPYQAPQQAQNPSGSGYGETSELPYRNETMVLGGQMINNGVLQSVRLIRQKTGETIYINKASFWFGKDAGNVDYCLTDNAAISRRHALITIRNNECFIQDNHSTNRTFLNGHVLEAGVDTPLSDGDRVRMGDEEFTVSIG
ncbi:MAG TPA: FHA domain-containing protein [Candidatus Mediterraneibacter faecigallinarum]|uniref:FHA domain-containing protein n=1 Tax=Candidatus Mediterraneibacter faecigallinarum TaxID=2838669 RepID=A0A9D2NTL2_9FIRM|nr:FHA domain-containing protein [Candidatus Mediterraneibacter faecigallinarum]